MSPATNTVAAVVSSQAKADAVQAFIMHHVVDSSTLKLPGISFELPRYLHLHGVMVIFSAVLLVLWLALIGRRRQTVPTGALNLVESFVVFIRDKVAVPYLGEADGRRMTPVFCSLFFFILTMNLVGLVPAFATATSNVSVTGALATVTLFFMIFGAMYRHGPVGFVRGFIPHGVPWPVALLLVPIEMTGLAIKAFALTIRLFANELAGHIVVFFLLGLIVMFGAVATPFVGMAVLIYILEIFVAFLQAYIFTLLSAIFIGERFHPEH